MNGGKSMRVKVMLLALALSVPATAQNLPTFRQPRDYPRYPAAGSVYVPLDSWVYPALERLAALRYIVSDFRGMRPWTRIECARLTDEAGEAIAEALRGDKPPLESVTRFYRALEKEFAAELDVLGGGRNRTLQLESAYARVLSLSGPILNDGYHFGQTIANDYGRPFRRGTNGVAGVAVRAAYGPFFAYAWGEYQHSPSAPALSDNVRSLVASQDALPIRPGVPFQAINRFRLLDTYVGMNVKNWQVSFGRQSLWWGTSEGGPLLFSTNAGPVNLLRLNRVVPFRLPSILGVLGPVRVDVVVGRLGGHEVAKRPWIQGQRVSFKVTPSSEFAVTHTAIFGGDGRPGGIDVFFKTLFPFKEMKRETRGGESLSDQYISFDFLYRYRSWVTWYWEALSSDMSTPFANISRAAMLTGVYFPRLPRLDHLDLRIEGVYTDSPGDVTAHRGILHYWHFNYRSGYTNNGVLLANPIGRSGAGFQAWATYWFSPISRFQLGFKRTRVSSDFVPGGGLWSDFSVRHDYNLKSGFYLRSSAQIERLKYRFLFSQLHTNLAVSVELRYSPERAGK